MESRTQDQIEGAPHSQQEAMERIAQLESDLATAEQDSRQKQARIERLEKAVKELRDALAWMVENDETNEGDIPLEDHMGATWNEINEDWIRGLNRSREALKNTENF